MKEMFSNDDFTSRQSWITKMGKFSLGLFVLFLLVIKGMAIYSTAFYLLLVSLIIYSFKRRKFPSLPDRNLLIAYGFFCVCLLLAGIMQGEYSSIKSSASYVYRTLPFLLLYFGVSCFGSREIVYKSFLAAMAANAGIVAYWYFQVWDRHSRIDIIDGPNLTIVVLSLSLIFGLLAVYRYRHKKFVVFIGTISTAILLSGIWWTGSRGGMMGLGVGGLVTYFCHLFAKKKDRFKRPVIVSAIVLIVGSLSVLALTAVLFPRDASDNGRLCIYKSSVQMFIDHPVAGIGYANFTKEYMNYIQPEMPIPGVIPHAHNDFLQFLATTGIIGATGFSLFSLIFLLTLLKRVICCSEKAIYLAMLCTFITMYSHGLVDTAMWYNTGTRMVFGLLGIVLSIGDADDNNNQMN